MRSVSRFLPHSETQEISMDATTLLIILVVLLVLGGGGFYGRGSRNAP
jgi:hypothetical protein